jgi:hypothetical protein
MPVTARLSKAFYDRLGEDIAGELVTWFNAVDATYRSDLQTLNEGNFVHFDAISAQRFAEQDARIERRFAEFEVKVDRRFAEMDAKFEKRFAEMDAKFEKRFAEQDAKIERRLAELESRLVMRMFAFWAGSMVTLGGLIIALNNAHR